MSTPNLPMLFPRKRAWNKGRLVGQKCPLLPRDVWAIRVRLELAGSLRDFALFNPAVDSKLRWCDLVTLKAANVYGAGRVKEQTSILQNKTKLPVQFEIMECTRTSVLEWIDAPAMLGSQHLWPSWFHERLHI